MFTKFVFVLSIFLSTYAVAGEGSSVRGGGDIVICTTVTGERSESLFLADLIGNEFAVGPLYFQDFSADYAEAAILRYLDQYHTSDALKVRSALASLKFVLVDAPLPELNTKPNLAQQTFNRPDAYQLLMMGKPQVDFGYIPLVTCDKRQIAIQYFGLHQVRVNTQRFQKLSHFEQALLKIHEAYLQIASRKFKTLTRQEDFTRAKVFAIWSDFKHLKLEFKMKGSMLGEVGAQMIAVDCSHDLQFNLDTSYGLRLNQSAVDACVEEKLEMTGYVNCPQKLLTLGFDRELPTLNSSKIATAISFCRD